jgi:hypothetical protein
MRLETISILLSLFAAQAMGMNAYRHGSTVIAATPSSTRAAAVRPTLASNPMETDDDDEEEIQSRVKPFQIPDELEIPELRDDDDDDEQNESFRPPVAPLFNLFFH